MTQQSSARPTPPHPARQFTPGADPWAAPNSSADSSQFSSQYSPQNSFPNPPPQNLAPQNLAPQNWSQNSPQHRPAPDNSFGRPPYPEQSGYRPVPPGQPFPGRPGMPAPAPGFPARPQARYPAPPPPAPQPRRGRRVALFVGLVVVLLTVAGLAAAVLAVRVPEPVRVPDTGAIAQPGTLSVFQLQAGDCYNSTQAPPPPGQSQPISVVEAVQCDAPHTNQVIGRITYSPAEFATGVPDARADADCSGQFQNSLDPAAFSDPTLKPGRLTPADPATWARTPVVSCVVFSDAPISRSLLR